MRYLTIALGLLLCASASAQVPEPHLYPPLRTPFGAEPLQTSALRAYAYSVGIPLASVAGGYALYSLLPENGPDESAGRQGEAVAYAIMIAGGFTGSLVGNFTLGARDDLRTSLTVRTVAIVGGGGLMLTGGMLCVLSTFGGGQECSSGPLALVFVGLATFVGGTAGAIAYDLATIPANAREARERVEARQRQALQVGLGAHDGVPVVALRLGL